MRGCEREPCSTACNLLGETPDTREYVVLAGMGLSRCEAILEEVWTVGLPSTSADAGAVNKAPPISAIIAVIGITNTATAIASTLSRKLRRAPKPATIQTFSFRCYLNNEANRTTQLRTYVRDTRAYLNLSLPAGLCGVSRFGPRMLLVVHHVATTASS